MGILPHCHIIAVGMEQAQILVDDAFRSVFGFRAVTLP